MDRDAVVRAAFRGGKLVWKTAVWKRARPVECVRVERRITKGRGGVLRRRWTHRGVTRIFQPSSLPVRLAWQLGNWIMQMSNRTRGPSHSVTPDPLSITPPRSTNQTHRPIDPLDWQLYRNAYRILAILGSRWKFPTYFGVSLINIESGQAASPILFEFTPPFYGCFGFTKRFGFTCRVRLGLDLFVRLG